MLWGVTAPALVWGGKEEWLIISQHFREMDCYTLTS